MSLTYFRWKLWQQKLDFISLPGKLHHTYLQFEALGSSSAGSYGCKMWTSHLNSHGHLYAQLLGLRHMNFVPRNRHCRLKHTTSAEELRVTSCKPCFACQMHMLELTQRTGLLDARCTSAHSCQGNVYALAFMRLDARRHPALPAHSLIAFFFFCLTPSVITSMWLVQGSHGKCISSCRGYCF